MRALAAGLSMPPKAAQVQNNVAERKSEERLEFSYFLFAITFRRNGLVPNDANHYNSAYLVA